MYTRPQLIINCDNIRKNYEYLKAYVQPAIPACVVKDDAYGLGIREIGSILYRAGCRTFFVAYGCEAAKLRKMASRADIYVLQGFGKEEKSIFKKYDLRPILPTISAIAQWFDKPANRLMPGIQVETGLNRLGMTLDEMPSIRQLPFSLVLSHLACADDDKHSLNKYQLQQFEKYKEFFPQTPFSLSASDGVFLGKEYHFDMVRLGAALYGINTMPYGEKPVHNCVRVIAPILQIRQVSAGESVGYGASYKVSTPRQIATVSIGYGDGIFRSFSPAGVLHVECDGEIFPAPIVGRVSMDNITCDVTDIPENVLNRADYMTIIDDYYDLDDFAKVCGTIGYESLSNIGHSTRYIRKYEGLPQLEL